ncbi:Diaphanous GTPase-binding Domain [Teratosphaeria destructans]|uniref:Diaphanous GTPase-binding Domain n=1 Tax=Teratosphaeria destructans TaxID=418781 RepID=A0A9W7SYR8_9PEZI|nr:Diaphanous GTPase-binding Domain [Teratosphaeria destructans]
MPDLHVEPDHPDGPHNKPRALGERHGNVQSPPSSPSKSKTVSPKKSKSSANLGAMFAKMNRSSKDLSVKEKDKENTPMQPPPVPTPIWAQYARPTSMTNTELKNEIERYMPEEYSPSKQRSFQAPTLSRPRRSVEGRKSQEHRRFSGEMVRSIIGRYSEDSRKSSGSSVESNVAKRARVAELNVTKRGKVMAAVAAWGKSEEVKTDVKTVDEQFEQVLESRNIPEAQRQKMRSLTMRVKQDFIRQDRSGEKTGESREKSAKRTFTFGRSERRGESKQHSSRPNSLVLPKDSPVESPTSPLGSLKNAPAVPHDYISYLKKNQDPTTIEVGRLHKLRILLRNETVAWVDSFISLGGMTEIVGLLHRTMKVEWREEHEDQLLHETLLCLKGLCTTERAMQELEKVADELFPALLGMLFDEEKKGPAEYTTRTIIVNVLFFYLSSALNSSTLEERARKILDYLGGPHKAESETVDFVMEMRIPRPYKLWSREVSNVTKEVFWIFLHHMNVVSRSNQDGEDAANADTSTTFTSRHFPGPRPPVPAAPYIGGVEWDATTYLTAHLDLLNGLIASLPTTASRNTLRAELQASGFEKAMGGTLRTCKEKFYSGVHDGLRAWVAAAEEDGWDSRFVREGPTAEERLKSLSPKKVERKKVEKVEAPPKLDFSLGLKGAEERLDLEGDGWLG